MMNQFNFANAVMAIPEKLMALSDDPATQMSMLFPICKYDVHVIPSTAPIGEAEATIKRATASLCRRAALAYLANACANWKPDSWDEAQIIRQKIAELFSDEIIIAADEGNTETVAALRALRARVLDHLASAAGERPHLTIVKRNKPLPSLLLAQQLYANGLRAQELTKRAGATHPAFMPTSFQALTS